MTTPNISMAYVQGIQAVMAQKGLVNYASEKQASYDAGILGNAVEGNLAVDRGGLASEGASPGETDILANSLHKLAQVSSSEEKEGVLYATVTGLAQLQDEKFSKFSMAPGDNNVVAGHEPGSVAAGESDVKKEDLNKELTNAVPNTDERPEHWSAMPGKQKDGGKGKIGDESAAAGANAQGGPVSDQTELVNRVPNTRERPNYHGGPGDQKDEDQGHIGTEKGAALSDYLARL